MRRLWKDWEDQLIKQHYTTAKKDFLINGLHRTWCAIQQRASKKHKLLREKGANYANITYFDNWSNNMAYILGFIAADGCIIDRTKSSGDKVMSIGLSTKDYNHLLTIRNELSPNKRISKYIKRCNNKKYCLCYLRIGSSYLCDRLLDLGITPRKSQTLVFPNIPDKYVSHFVRGYFDGDGSFGVYGKYSEARVCFASGSVGFLKSLNNTIRKKCNLSYKNIIYGKLSRAHYLSYYSNEALSVCNWIYHDSEIHLERKYNKYKNYWHLREQNTYEPNDQCTYNVV